MGLRLEAAGLRHGYRGEDHPVLPFAPLCGKDCKGLCQTCGENLNERTCECKNERIDPRFESLKDLFKE